MLKPKECIDARNDNGVSKQVGEQNGVSKQVELEKEASKNLQENLQENVPDQQDAGSNAENEIPQEYMLTKDRERRQIK